MDYNGPGNGFSSVDSQEYPFSNPSTHDQEWPPRTRKPLPSELLNRPKCSAPPVTILPATAPLNNPHATVTRKSSSRRKTPTDKEKRRMCEFHEKDPTVKKTKIGNIFGFHRSTVSRVLKENMLLEDRSPRKLHPKRKNGGLLKSNRRALNIVDPSASQTPNGAGSPFISMAESVDQAETDKVNYFAQGPTNSTFHLQSSILTADARQALYTLSNYVEQKLITSPDQQAYITTLKDIAQLLP